MSRIYKAVVPALFFCYVTTGAYAQSCNQVTCLVVTTSLVYDSGSNLMISYSTAYVDSYYWASNYEITLSSTILPGNTYETSAGIYGVSTSNEQTAYPDTLFTSDAVASAYPIYEETFSALFNSASTQAFGPFVPTAAPPRIVNTSNQGAANCNAADISGTTRTVLVGQLVAFTACLPPGTAEFVTSMSWSPSTPSGRAVGGFIVSADTLHGQLVSLSATSCVVNQGVCDFPAFYWADQTFDWTQPQQRQFTFTYTLTTGSSSSASVIFSVDGPRGVTAGQTFSTVKIFNPPFATPGVDQLPILILGGGTPGIRFTATATNLASGNYRWAQLVAHSSLRNLGSNGSPPASDSVLSDPVIDHAYPYGFNANGSATGTVSAAGDAAQDSPYSYLITFYGEGYRYFSARMYLMWVAPARSDCSSGGGCVIPVPQGYVNWWFTGDAINTLQMQTVQSQSGPVTFPVWVKNCGDLVLDSNTYTRSDLYPVWNNAINP